MSVFDLFNPTSQKRRRYLSAGKTAEAQGDLEAAFTAYTQAAELGSSDAMAAIGDLYVFRSFRQVEKTNLPELLQGIPVFPWNLHTAMADDHDSALKWYRKAADLGNPRGCYLAGAFLCDSQRDIPLGLSYLEKAMAQGVKEAAYIHAIYAPPVRISISDQAYEALLREFQTAVEKESPHRFEQYARLKGGSDSQLARLGYLLTTRRNLNDPRYGLFRYLFDAQGIPLIPACCKRGNWRSFVRFDLNAFPPDTYLAFSSDIVPRYTLGYLHRLREAGTARYRSPAFGWLGEEKHPIVFRIDPDAVLTGEDLETAIRQFFLIPAEYEPENAAFFTECGEKEYSVELAAIHDGQVDVLFRYTIGGSEELKSSFSPELLSLELN